MQTANQRGLSAQIALKGMDVLESKVVPGAFHTADENYDAPKCHPNTRVAILDEIMAWLDDTNDTRRAMWMRGAAGAGKSAIARTIAQLCEQQGRMSSTFFFSRTSGDTRRSDEKHLVATLAYQMMEHIPETRCYISEAMADNKFIFDLALDSQVDKLIVIPLSRLSEISSSPIPPKIIIIDGLDECHNKNAQDVIVKKFVAALARMQHKLPHKLLIASRPEQNIQSSFGHRELAPFLRHLPLDNSWKPDDDIRTFLVDNFHDIRQTHLLRRYIPINWPALCDIEKLVEKSSGQFIYAATVGKYIKSNERDPVECLRIVINLVKDPENRPYAELDALYAHIFAQARKPELALWILRIHLMGWVDPDVELPDQEICFIDRLLGLREGKLELTLSDLLSIVEVEDLEIKFLHASLPDFLLDETRSRRFYANSDKICIHLFRHCLNYISEFTGNTNDDDDYLTILTCFLGTEQFTENVQEAHTEIWDAFAGLDLKAALKLASKMADEIRWNIMPNAVANFLRCILREHTKLCSSQTPDVLLKVVNQLQEWILNQVQKLSLDGPISSSLENNDIKNLDNSPELYFCWSLMFDPKLTAVFCGIKQLEAFTMNGNQYAYAALYCCYVIFSNLSDLSDKVFSEPFSTIYFIQNRSLVNLSVTYAHYLLDYAAPRVDVYLSLQNLLMIRLNSMQEDLCQACSSDEHRTCLVSHLERHFRQQFLELHDSFSEPKREWKYLVDSLVDYLVKTHEEFPPLEEQGLPHVQDERQTIRPRAEHPRHPMSTRRSSSPLQAQLRNDPISKKHLRTNSDAVPQTKKPRKE